MECEEWFEKVSDEATLFGVPFERIRELFDLFYENGYDLSDEQHWGFVKRDYFKITVDNKKIEG